MNESYKEYYTHTLYYGWENILRICKSLIRHNGPEVLKRNGKKYALKDFRLTFSILKVLLFESYASKMIKTKWENSQKMEENILLLKIRRNDALIEFLIGSMKEDWTCVCDGGCRNILYILKPLTWNIGYKDKKIYILKHMRLNFNILKSTITFLYS